MGIPDLVGEKIALAVLDRVVGDTYNDLLQDLRPELEKIGSRLDSIQYGLEQERSRYLKAALAFFALGELERARNELVIACAADKRNAMAHLLLGMILAQEGKREHALQYVAKSWRINPYVLWKLQGAAKVCLSATHKDAPLRPWRVKEPQMKLVAAPFQVKGWFRKKRNTYALEAISCAPGHVVVCWRFMRKGRPGEGEVVLSVFDLSNGRERWSSSIGETRLVMASPDYVVLSPREANLARYTFFATENGAPAGEMGSEYFQTVFCPDFNDLQNSKFHRTSQSDFTLAMDVQKDFAERLSAYENLPRRIRKTRQAPKDIRVEEGLVRSPQGEWGGRLRGWNKWSYEREVVHNPGVASFTYYKLGCTSFFERY